MTEQASIEPTGEVNRSGSGYEGLENHLDWSHFYINLLENTARNTIQDQDPETGRFTRIEAGSAGDVPNTAAYSFILAEAYKSPHSSYYGNKSVRDQAIAAFDYVARQEVGRSGNGANLWAVRAGATSPQFSRNWVRLAEFLITMGIDRDPGGGGIAEAAPRRGASHEVSVHETA